MIGLAIILATQSAVFMGGNELYDYCNGDSDGVMICTAYVAGVADGIAASQAVSDQAVICVPEQVSRDQLRDVALKYLRDHSEKRQMHAAALLYFALAGAFPCSKP